MPLFSFFKSSKSKSSNSRRASESGPPRPARSDYVSRMESTTRSDYAARSDFGPRASMVRYRTPVHGKSPAAAAARRRAQEEALRRQREETDSYESGDSLDLESSDDVGSLRFDELMSQRHRGSARHAENYEVEPPTRRQFRRATSENRALLTQLQIAEMRLQRVEAKIKDFEDKSAQRQKELDQLRLRDRNHHQTLEILKQEEHRLNMEGDRIKNVQQAMNTPPNTQPRQNRPDQMPIVPQNSFATPPVRPMPPQAAADSANSRCVHTETTGSPFSPRTPINPQTMQRVFQGDLWGQIGALSRPRSAVHLHPYESPMGPAMSAATPTSRIPTEKTEQPKTPSTIPIDQLNASPQPGPSKHNAANQTPPHFPGDEKNLSAFSHPTPPRPPFNCLQPSLFAQPPDFSHQSDQPGPSGLQFPIDENVQPAHRPPPRPPLDLTQPDCSPMNMNTSQSLFVSMSQNLSAQQSFPVAQSPAAQLNFSNSQNQNPMTQRNPFTLHPFFPGTGPPFHNFPMANFLAQMPMVAENDCKLSDCYSVLSDVAEEPRSAADSAKWAESTIRLIPLERIEEEEMEAINRTDSSSQIVNLRHVNSDEAESDKENQPQCCKHC